MISSTVKFRFGFDLPFTDPGNKALTLAAAGSVLATTLVCEVPAPANVSGPTPFCCPARKNVV